MNQDSTVVLTCCDGTSLTAKFIKSGECIGFGREKIAKVHKVAFQKSCSSDSAATIISAETIAQITGRLRFSVTIELILPKEEANRLKTWVEGVMKNS